MRTYCFGSNRLRATEVASATVQDYGVHLHQFTGNALYFFTSKDRLFRPFATAGLGVSRYSPTAVGAFRAAPRLSRSRNRHSALWTAGNGHKSHRAFLSRSGRAQNFEISTGLTYYFAGAK